MVDVGIGAGGFLGIGVEDTPNQYKAPTKFLPIMSESLTRPQDTVFRRPIRQTAGVVGAVDGNTRVEGEVSMEAFEAAMPYMLQAARTTTTKDDTGIPDLVYNFKPNPNATAAKTLSFTVVRNGEVFGYVGCVLGSFTFTVDNGQLMFNFAVLGSDESEQTLPTPTWEDLEPFGAGKYSIQIPTATQVFDMESFEFTAENNAESQYRLKNTGRGAEFVKYGENNSTMTTERDFHDRSDYETYKNSTAQSITLRAERSAANYIEIVMPAAIKSEYTVGLSGEGDLIRASISYQCVIDENGDMYSIEVGTQEDVTVT